MNKLFFTSLALATVVTSCGKNQGSVDSHKASFNKNNIVLGAFNDVKVASTLNLEQLKDLPKVVDLRADQSAVKNQSDRGTCTFFATVALLEGSIKKDLKKEVNLSEEYLNYATKSSGYYSREEGSSVGSNLSAAQAKGIMLERDWSYQPTWFGKGLPCAKYKNTDSSAPATCFSHSAPNAEAAAKIIPMNGLTTGSISKNTNEAIKFLAKYKRPLTVDVPVNFNGWPNTGDVYHNEQLRAECIQDDHNCGGHAVLLVGYDMDRKVFFFKNSWGTGWGQNGFGTITFDTIDRYVAAPMYYAQATDKLAIPVDYAQDNLSLESFTSSVKMVNGAVNVNVDAKVNNANGRIIYVSSFVSKKYKSIAEAASDANAQVVALNSTESQTLGGESSARALQFYLLGQGDTLDLSGQNSLALQIPASTMAMDSVAAVMNSDALDPLMRTTIYVHTDDQTYKVLKREYLPIAK